MTNKKNSSYSWGEMKKIKQNKAKQKSKISDGNKAMKECYHLS